MLRYEKASRGGTTVGKPSWWWQAVYSGLVVAILLGLANAATPFVTANHRTSQGDHQAKQTQAGTGVEENVCVVSSLEHISHSSLRSVIRRKLYIDSPAEDWDELAENRIWFDMPLVNGTVQPCHGFPNRASIPIEVYMAHDVSIHYPNWISASPCGNISCQDNQVLIYNNSVGHYDSRDSLIWFQERALYNSDHTLRSNEQRSFIISHEFGHALGLADGGAPGDTLCGSSVMHAGKGSCGTTPYVYWPTAIDHETVINNAYGG